MRSVSKGSVEQRAKGKWRLKVSVTHDDGTPERICKNVECRTKTDARAKLDEWRMGLLSKGEVASHGEITLEDYLWQHIGYLHDVKGISPNTLRGYRDIVKSRWVPNLGLMPLKDVKPYAIEEQLRWMRAGGGRNGRPVSGTTCQKAFSFLKTALKHAVRLGYVGSNPCDMLDGPTKEKARMSVLDECEVKRMKTLLKGHPDYRFAMAVNLALDTGMRRGELCGLLWRDVDLEGKRLHVCRALAEASREDTYNGETLQDKEPKSFTSDRWVSLSDETVDMLKAHAEAQFYRLKYYDAKQTADTSVLCGSLGEDYRPSKLTSDFIAFSQNHGFEVTFHELRHTHASLLLKHGVSIQYVSQRLGHENIAITYRFYAHFLPGDDGGSADTWGEVAYIGGDVYAGFPPVA